MKLRSFQQHITEAGKARAGIQSAYAGRSDDDLKDMHARWSKDFSDKNFMPQSGEGAEKLRAVHAELTKKGHKMSLPKHPYLDEETMPYAVTAKGSINIEDPSVRDGLNSILTSTTSDKFVTPYIAFEKVQKALANFLIFPKRPTFLEGDSGLYTNPIRQFGDKMGQMENGDFVEDNSEDLHLYFEYAQDDDGMFKVFCEIVDEDELDDLLADVEDEIDSEDEDGEEDLDEGAMVDSGFVVKHKNKETGETKENRVRADDAKAARNRVEGHYSHDSNQWKHVSTKKLDEENLEETSEKTAKQYLKHAGADGRFWSRERNYPGNTPEENATARRKVRNRAAGVKRAQAVLDRKKVAE